MPDDREASAETSPAASAAGFGITPGFAASAAASPAASTATSSGTGLYVVAASGSGGSTISTSTVAPLPPARSLQRISLRETSDIPDGTSQFHTGIIGPTGSGKSYLFQGLVSRLTNPGKYGVLTRYLKKNGVSLWQASKPGSKGHFWILDQFNERYRNWTRLPANRVDEIHWYYLLLTYRTGWLGRKEPT